MHCLILPDGTTGYKFNHMRISTPFTRIVYGEYHRSTPRRTLVRKSLMAILSPGWDFKRVVRRMQSCEFTSPGRVSHRTHMRDEQIISTTHLWQRVRVRDGKALLVQPSELGFRQALVHCFQNIEALEQRKTRQFGMKPGTTHTDTDTLPPSLPSLSLHPFLWHRSKVPPTGTGLRF